MKDNERTIELVDQLAEMHSQNAELKKSIAVSRSAELAAEEQELYAESIVGTVREPLLVLDADLKIILANRNFYKTFKDVKVRPKKLPFFKVGKPTREMINSKDI